MQQDGGYSPKFEDTMLTMALFQPGCLWQPFPGRQRGLRDAVQHPCGEPANSAGKLDVRTESGFNKAIRPGHARRGSEPQKAGGLEPILLRGPHMLSVAQVGFTCCGASGGNAVVSRLCTGIPQTWGVSKQQASLFGRPCQVV